MVCSQTHSEPICLSRASIISTILPGKSYSHCQELYKNMLSAKKSYLGSTISFQQTAIARCNRHSLQFTVVETEFALYSEFSHLEASKDLVRVGIKISLATVLRDRLRG